MIKWNNEEEGFLFFERKSLESIEEGRRQLHGGWEEWLGRKIWSSH
jgi:hypothetical protein